MENKISIFLHVGQGKTGSSAIQNFLDINREKLFDKYKLLYPNVNNGEFNQGRCHNQGIIFNFPGLKIKKTLEKIIRYAVKNDINKIVLSYEGIFGAAYWEDDQFAAIFNSLKLNYPIEWVVILYIRRIDHLIESSWKQWGLKSYSTIDEYIKDYLGSNKALLIKHVNYLRSILGDRKDLIIRPYEKEQLKNGLISDFLNNLGISYANDTWKEIEKSNVAENHGFQREVIDMLSACGQLYNDAHDNRYFDLFSELLGEGFQKNPFEEYDLLSGEQKYFLLNRFEPQYQQIAKEYLDRTDGKLFYEKWPTPEIENDEYSLTLEKVVPVFTKMIFELNSKIDQQQRTIESLMDQSGKKSGKYKFTFLSNALFSLASGINAFFRTRDPLYSFTAPPIFDEEWYLSENPDVKNKRIPAYAHYLRFGWKEHRNPSPYFSLWWYENEYLEKNKQNVDPLFHYLKIGWKQGFDPGPNFSVKKYYQNYPGVKEKGIEPLSHYLQQFK